MQGARWNSEHPAPVLRLCAGGQPGFCERPDDSLNERVSQLYGRRSANQQTGLRTEGIPPVGAAPQRTLSTAADYAVAGWAISERSDSAVVPPLSLAVHDRAAGWQLAVGLGGSGRSTEVADSELLKPDVGQS